MALSQKGASYLNRAHILGKDRLHAEALDDIVSQVQAGLKQGNLSVTGKSPSPAAPITIAVVGAGGFAKVSVTHSGSPATILQYSTTPNFQNPQTVDNGFSETFERYLAGQTLYFRAAATLYTSPQSGWTYFGSAQNPTPTTF